MIEKRARVVLNQINFPQDFYLILYLQGTDINVPAFLDLTLLKVSTMHHAKKGKRLFSQVVGRFLYKITEVLSII